MLIIRQYNGKLRFKNGLIQNTVFSYAEKPNCRAYAVSGCGLEYHSMAGGGSGMLLYPLLKT